MSDQIAILCHIEHLPAYNGFKPNFEAFSLNVSVAAVGNPAISDDAKLIFQPWKAKALLKVNAALIPIANPSTPDTPIWNLDIQPQFWNSKKIDPTTGDFSIGGLTTRLGSAYSACEAPATTPPGQVSPCFKWKQDEIEVETNESNQVKPWHILLGQTAQLPTPIPQLLNLSTIFFIDRSALTGRMVVAAPIIEFDRVDSGIVRKFLIEPEPDLAKIIEMPMRPSGRVWDYRRSSGSAVLPSISAYIEPCQLQTGVSTDRFLDLGSLWVKKTTNDLTFDEDWVAKLSTRMADTFDVSRRLIEYLRHDLESHLATPNPARETEILKAMPEYRRMFLCSLRDITGIGVGVGPDRTSLIERIFSYSDRTALEPAEDRMFGTLEQWRKFLVDNLPSLSKLAVLGPNYNEILNLADSIAEMEQLHQAVLDPATLPLLLKAQWKIVFKDANLPLILQQKIETTDLSQMNLRWWLSMSNLGKFWSDFVNSGLTDASGSLTVREKFRCYFQAYAALRFGATIPANCSGVPNNAAGKFDPRYVSLDANISNPVIDGLILYIANWCGSTAGDLQPDAATTTTQTEKQTDVPHPIAVVVDRVTGDGSGDLLSKFSGVALLMREAGASSWRCLNMAKAKLNIDADAALFTEPVLVPSRLSYSNDLKQAILLYNNHPLAARSPAASMTDHHPKTTETLAEKWDSLVAFDYHPDAKLSALKFGREFEIAPFIIGNAGAIPPCLTRGSAPCPVTTPTPTPTPTPSGTPPPIPPPNPSDFAPGDIHWEQVRSVPAEFVRTVPYQRRVKVGQIRVSNTENATCIELPEIPEGVHPRLRDIKLTSLLKEPTKGHEYPLILLAPNDDDWKSKSSFSFKIKLPAVDINTWDRWVSGNPMFGAPIGNLRDLRINVWQQYHERIAARRKLGKCEAVPITSDVSLDDPALEPTYRIELMRFANGQFNTRAAPPISVTVPRKTAAELASTQLEAVTIKTEVRNVLAETLTEPASRSVLAIVKKGELYKLRISCCIRKDLFGLATATPLKPFANIYQQPVLDSLDGTFFKVSTYELFIETATDVIDPGNGLSGLTTSFDPDTLVNEKPADVVTARFLNVNSDVLFPYVYKAELMRQLWRWQGRDTKPHVESTPLTGADKTAYDNKWIAAEYGNRSDLDHSIVNMKSKVENTATGDRIFNYTEHLTGPHAKNDDLRGAHYRFMATIYSRYAALMKEPVNGQKSSTGGWVSRFVPSRVAEADVKPPKVKLIFPLTRNYGETTEGSAGLLVVLDEPWFEVGGLGETIGVEVVMSPDPKNDPNAPGQTKYYYYEVGYDPIVSGAPLYPVPTPSPTPTRSPTPTPTAINVGSVTFPEANIRGPVGHTFDRSSDAPLLLTTSFIVPAPSISRPHGTTEPDKLPPWGMCKLRLRRIIHTVERQQPKRVVGEYTDPFWTQFLPDFSVLKQGNIADMLLRPAIDGKTLRVHSPTDSEVKLDPGKSDPGSNVFELYMVLTKEVFDATGRSDQEAYIGVLYQNPDPLNATEWKADGFTTIPTDQSDRLRARIIEVQRRKNSNSQPPFKKPDELWTALFDKAIRDFDRARIVRISDPFGTTPREKC